MNVLTDSACSVLERLAREVESPRGLAVFLMARHKEWSQLQQLPPVQPHAYDDPHAYKRDAIVSEFARKSPPVKASTRLHEEAVRTFWACEAQCAATNARLSPYLHNGPFQGSTDLRIRDFVSLWRSVVGSVLGKLPHRIDFRFSPGATTSNKGRLITIPDKLSTPPTFYPACTDLRPYIDCTGWGRMHPTATLIERGNKFFSVPKDASKNRGCCKEASGAVALQLGVGSALRARLFKAGIDLDLGQDIHRALAAQASSDGSLITVDLSNASDTIARKLIQLILPDDWFTLLNSLRAPVTFIGDKAVHLNKFSSMGNGFTFELETIVFWTLAVTVGLSHGIPADAIKVYGDDIIAPSEQAFVEDLLAAFRFFGFTPNMKKTFVAGPFRESCGGDFFSGVPVRPAHLRNYLTEPHEWISLHNRLYELDDPPLTGRARQFILNNLPSELRRLRGPRATFGDIFLWDDDASRWTFTEIPGWEACFMRAYLPVVPRVSLRRWAPEVALNALLYGVPSAGVSRRGEVLGHRITRVVSDFQAAAAWRSVQIARRLR